ncbi:MAG TPA: amidohydrolase, partial [Chthoniobacterales bacterium]|nr:amidohydrolase [Chthoniobacterales bacterium]
CTAPPGKARPENAETVFINGNIYTMNERQPRAEAIAVKGDRIVFVGSNADAKKYQVTETKTIDLAGKTVVPGLTDSHCHIFGIGEREINLNLEGANTVEDFLAKVKERVAKAERGKWITGRGWIETFWKPPQFPARADLDAIAPDNPVFLIRADGHASIANSAALRIAKIDKETPNPFGGEILRDKQTGEATGMLLDHAEDLVGKNIPAPTEAERREAFVVGVKRELSLGWCEIQNAGSNLEDLPLMRQAFEAGQCKLRVYNAVYAPGPAGAALLNDGPTLNQYGHRFTQRTIKVVFDGALGSRGAALLEPYSDAPTTSGYLTEKEAQLQPIFEEALRRGVQIETHAIGDRANRVILDLYEKAMKTVPPEQRKIREPRWRVEHAQILNASDIPRFSKLGVIASMQPSHAISDLFFAPSRLGKERLAGAYAWQTLLKSGAIICGGSDAPVQRGEPMIEFYAAVARKPLPEHGLLVRAPSGVELRSAENDRGENSREAHRPEAYVPAQPAGWHPEQAISREQALKMFTVAAAYAAFEEQDKGSIEAGKLADLTVLSADIMKIPEPEIPKTICAMTVIGGEIAYEPGK